MDLEEGKSQMFHEVFGPYEVNENIQHHLMDPDGSSMKRPTQIGYTSIKE